MPDRQQREDAHESYGMINFTRSQGTHQNLFGSSILHREIMIMEISTAVRHRTLGQDLILTEQLILRAMMSSKQFTDMITGAQQGSGTPITLKFVLGDRKNRENPPRPRQREDAQEEMSRHIQDVLGRLDRMTESARTQKDRRELQGIAQSLRNTLPFLQEEFVRQMDRTVQEATAEIETFLTERERATGIQALREMQQALPDGIPEN